ncbi:MAG TPA: hypothetical protein V6C93_34325, partial [Allocoleopsis sp.]
RNVMLLANIQFGDVSIQLITFFLAIYASGVVKGSDRMECSTIMRSLHRGSLAIEIGLSRATITSFFTGKRVDYLNFVEISEKLGLDWQAIAYIAFLRCVKYRANNLTPSSRLRLACSLTLRSLRLTLSLSSPVPY